MKALTEEAEKTGIESGKTDLAPVGKNTTKKKVKIVKKIVKKKIIRKVPKRVPVASSHCNDIEKVASPNPNDNSPMEAESFVPVEIENPNLVVNDSTEVEDMKEFEVSNKDKDVRLVENNDCCRVESQRSELVSASLLGDQTQIELHDSEHTINNMDAEEHAGEEGVKEQEEKVFKMDDGVSEDTKVEENVKEHTERSECGDANANLAGGLSNGVKEEEDMDKQVDNKEHIDLKLSDAVEPEEGMKEVVNNGLKSQGSSEKQVMSGEMVASRLNMKHRTKVFIHGFDKETKEEDIRKVFEKVGEVVEVRLITNFRSGKSRGCGFIKYASADLARLALNKYNTVEIRGRLCHTAAVDGSDTILLNNINKNWNNEHVLTLLQKIGIKNIDEVSVVSDPKNPNLNLGFAYLELETKRDAQVVYNKLQNKNIFGAHSNIKVTWAHLSADPVKEEIHNNNNNNTTTTTNNNNNNDKNSKSVYAENIPCTWGEKEVRDHFGKFGEIESIALAKNIRSTTRNDFAFINYKKCEGALSCIEALTCKKSMGDDGLKVSLSKSMPKVKSMKTISGSTGSTVTEVKQKTYLRPHKKPQNMKISSISRHDEDGRRKAESSSTTDELVKLLREQASWKHGGPSLTLTPGMNTGHHHHHQHQHQPSFGFGGKQLFTQVESRSLYHDPQSIPYSYHQTHLQIPNAAATTHPRFISRPTTDGVAMPMTSFPHIDPQHGRYTSGSFNGNPVPRYFQTRDQTTYHGSSSGSSIYRQMH
ncbi:uncharacterized protein LOC111916598 [Lactuca sativa]|uniref:RRM domain-containing protein n=1 Tax=Lactuca sativa TaxID=4236 RepID=A0A9R1XWN2_LACSA|nr:uncharacterized protein LOC111916598 [Lactuca sativa]KAJ0224974.1 hypothetical protein LSAT_V11C100022890 [Lactuca sativa]